MSGTEQEKKMISMNKKYPKEDKSNLFDETLGNDLNVYNATRPSNYSVKLALKHGILNTSDTMNQVQVATIFQTLRKPEICM